MSSSTLPTLYGMLQRSLSYALLPILCLLAGLETAMAQAIPTESDFKSAPKIEFRIDTDLYTDESKPPIGTTQTVFVGNRVFEWDDTHRTLLVVDYQDQSVTLADLRTQTKCRFNMSDLEQRLSKLRTQMTSEQLRLWTAQSNPAYGQDGYFSLASERATYVFKTAPAKSEGMAIQYAEFADWSVRLYAVNPPFKPPLLRMQLNAFLREKKDLPIEIRLSDLRSKGTKPITARLIVQSELSSTDRERVRD